MRMPGRFLKNSSPKSKHILVLDVGTTGIKAFIFDTNLSPIARVYRKLNKFSPKRGWVEQNPKELLRVSRGVLREAVKKSGLSGKSFFGLGLTNQRETTILWDKKTGNPIYPAIVWEDERTKSICAKLKKFEKKVRSRTGLPINPYFSASKIQWVLKRVVGTKERLGRDELAFGTVDSWILWNFLEDAPHLTDLTNASRTLLFNIKKLGWDDELLDIFQIPRKILPQVKPSQAPFGQLKKEVLGFPLAVLAVAGDQQASMYAACPECSRGAGSKKGITKVTYGTGTFMMQVLGSRFRLYPEFFTTLLVTQGKPLYAIEAKIEGSGDEVEKTLGKPTLDKVILKLARKVDVYLKRMPVKPQRLIIDGGITKAKGLGPTQAQISGLLIQKQAIFDGTALGTAKLVKDFRGLLGGGS